MSPSVKIQWLFLLYRETEPPSSVFHPFLQCQSLLSPGSSWLHIFLGRSVFQSGGHYARQRLSKALMLPFLLWKSLPCPSQERALPLPQLHPTDGFTILLRPAKSMWILGDLAVLPSSWVQVQLLDTSQISAGMGSACALWGLFLLPVRSTVFMEQSAEMLAKKEPQYSTFWPGLLSR